MLDRAKLEALKAAALAEDWRAVGEAFSDLGLEASTSADRLNVKTLRLAVRLRDSEAVAALVDDIISNGKA